MRFTAKLYAPGQWQGGDGPSEDREITDDTDEVFRIFQLALIAHGILGEDDPGWHRTKGGCIRGCVCAEHRDGRRLDIVPIYEREATPDG